MTPMTYEYACVSLLTHTYYRSNSTNLPPVCITVTVYTVTSRSVTVQWQAYPGASHYRVQATSSFTPGHSPAFSMFNSNTVVGGLNTLFPNTVYTMQVDAMDDHFTILSSIGTEEALTGQLT